MFDLCEFGICGQARKESLDGRLQATSRNQKDEQTDGGNSERDVGDQVEAGSGDPTYCGDEHEHEDEDVEELFEDHGTEDGGG